MSRRWVYYRLRELAEDGRAAQTQLPDSAQAPAVHDADS